MLHLSMKLQVYSYFGSVLLLFRTVYKLNNKLTESYKTRLLSFAITR